MSKPGVLLLDNIHPAADRIFADNGMGLLRHGALADVPERELGEVVMLGIRSKTPVDAALLERMPRLIAVGAFGVGINQLDLEALSGRGIALFNAPYSNTRSVVELALGQMLALLRRSGDRNREMHDGTWNKAAGGAQEARGKTIGIIGYGNVGSQLSVLCEALGMNVLYHDLTEKLALGNARAAGMEQILRQSDILSLHIDGGSGNRHIIGRAELDMMRPGAMLVNMSRGSLVDVEALAASLRAGHLGGAALDVFPDEPGSSPAQFRSPLQGMPNVLLSPHIGGSTEQAQRAIALYTPRRLVDYYRLGNSMGSVNLPNVRLGDSSPGSHRLLHIHRNSPGALATINSLFAKHQCNIVAQHLKTNEDLGYVISDIDKSCGDNIARELAQAGGTILFRVLS